MAPRFQKRVKIAPGLRVNISRRGASLTGGVSGLSVTKGKDGTHLNTGIPGSGLSNRTKLSNAKTKPTETTEAEPKKGGAVGVFIVTFILAVIAINLIF